MTIQGKGAASRSDPPINIADFLIAATLPVICGYAILAPQGLTWLPWLIILLALWAARRLNLETHPWERLPAARWLFWAMAAAAIWTLMRCITAYNVPDAFLGAGSFYATVFAVVLLVPLSAAVSRDGRWFWLFFPLVNIITASIAGLAANQVIQLGWISARLGELWHFNRAASLAALLLPVSLYAVGQTSGPRRDKALMMIAVTGAIGVGVFSTYSESAKLAFIIGLAVNAAAQVSLKLTTRLVSWGFVISLLVVPSVLPTVHDWTISNHALDQDTWTYRPRLEIWRAMVHLIVEAPFFGHGVEFVRNAGYINAITGLWTEQTHPHSAIFQLWVDLGLLGVVLFGTVIVLLGETILWLPREKGAMLAAVMAGALGVWSVSHGMWQSWFVGLIGLVVFHAMVAARRGAP